MDEVSRGIAKSPPIARAHERCLETRCQAVDLLGALPAYNRGGYRHGESQTLFG